MEIVCDCYGMFTDGMDHLRVKYDTMYLSFFARSKCRGAKHASVRSSKEPPVMISQALQARIRTGEEDAFRLMYGEYSGEIYRCAKSALKNEDAARRVVKTVMVSLYRTMCDAGTAIDTDQTVEELTRSAIDASAATAAPRHIGSDRQEETAGSGSFRRVGTAEEPRRSVIGTFFSAIGLIVFLAAGIWSLCGMLMALGILPVRDLGYSFFDTHVFPLFLLK